MVMVMVLVMVASAMWRFHLHHLHHLQHHHCLKQVVAGSTYRHTEHFIYGPILHDCVVSAPRRYLQQT